MNTITIELCAEDRARLDNILAALQKSPLERAGAALGSMTKAVEAAAKEISTEEKEAVFFGQAEPKPKKQEAPTPAPAAPEPKPAEAVPEVDTATLQSKVVQLVNAGKRDEAKAIILEYAPCVSQVPAEKRAEALTRLNKLEG